MYNLQTNEPSCNQGEKSFGEIYPNFKLLFFAYDLYLIQTYTNIICVLI